MYNNGTIAEALWARCHKHRRAEGSVDRSEEEVLLR